MRPNNLVLSASMLALTLGQGCGVSGVARIQTPETIAGENTSDGVSTGQQVVIPVSGNADLPDPADIDSIVDDFFADDAPSDTIIGPDEFANFLAFLNDAFVAELFRDTPAIGGAESSIPRLQRICVQQGTPEFICRQRYGN